MWAKMMSKKKKQETVGPQGESSDKQMQVGAKTMFVMDKGSNTDRPEISQVDKIPQAAKTFRNEPFFARPQKGDLKEEKNTARTFAPRLTTPTTADIPPALCKEPIQILVRDGHLNNPKHSVPSSWPCLDYKKTDFNGLPRFYMPKRPLIEIRHHFAAGATTNLSSPQRSAMSQFVRTTTIRPAGQLIHIPKPLISVTPVKTPPQRHHKIETLRKAITPSGSLQKSNIPKPAVTDSNTTSMNDQTKGSQGDLQFCIHHEEADNGVKGNQTKVSHMICVPGRTPSPGTIQASGSLLTSDRTVDKSNQLSLRIVSQMSNKDASMYAATLNMVTPDFRAEMRKFIDSKPKWPGLLLIYRTGVSHFQFLPPCLTSTVDKVQCYFSTNVLAVFMVMTKQKGDNQITAIPLPDQAQICVEDCIRVAGFQGGVPNSSNPSELQNLRIAVTDYSPQLITKGSLSSAQNVTVISNDGKASPQSTRDVRINTDSHAKQGNFDKAQEAKNNAPSLNLKRGNRPLLRRRSSIAGDNKRKMETEKPTIASRMPIDISSVTHTNGSTGTPMSINSTSGNNKANVPPKAGKSPRDPARSSLDKAIQTTWEQLMVDKKSDNSKSARSRDFKTGAVVSRSRSVGVPRKQVSSEESAGISAAATKINRTFSVEKRSTGLASNMTEATSLKMEAATQQGDSNESCGDVLDVADGQNDGDDSGIIIQGLEVRGKQVPIPEETARGEQAEHDGLADDCYEEDMIGGNSFIECKTELAIEGTACFQGLGHEKIERAQIIEEKISKILSELEENKKRRVFEEMFPVFGVQLEPATSKLMRSFTPIVVESNQAVQGELFCSKTYINIHQFKQLQNYQRNVARGLSSLIESFDSLTRLEKIGDMQQVMTFDSDFEDQELSPMTDCRKHLLDTMNWFGSALQRIIISGKQLTLAEEEFVEFLAESEKVEPLWMVDFQDVLDGSNMPTRIPNTPESSGQIKEHGEQVVAGTGDEFRGEDTENTAENTTLISSMSTEDFSDDEPPASDTANKDGTENQTEQKSSVSTSANSVIIIRSASSEARLHDEEKGTVLSKEEDFKDQHQLCLPRRELSKEWRNKKAVITYSRADQRARSLPQTSTPEKPAIQENSNQIDATADRNRRYSAYDEGIFKRIGYGEWVVDSASSEDDIFKHREKMSDRIWNMQIPRRDSTVDADNRSSSSGSSLSFEIPLIAESADRCRRSLADFLDDSDESASRREHTEEPDMNVTKRRGKSRNPDKSSKKATANPVAKEKTPKSTKYLPPLTVSTNVKSKSTKKCKSTKKEKDTSRQIDEVPPFEAPVKGGVFESFERNKQNRDSPLFDPFDFDDYDDVNVVYPPFENLQFPESLSLGSPSDLRLDIPQLFPEPRKRTNNSLSTYGEKLQLDDDPTEKSTYKASRSTPAGSTQKRHTVKESGDTRDTRPASKRNDSSPVKRRLSDESRMTGTPPKQRQRENSENHSSERRASVSASNVTSSGSKLIKSGEKSKKKKFSKSLFTLEKPEIELVRPMNRRGFQYTEECRKVLDEIFNHPYCEPFRDEIRSSEVPGYHKIIKYPMHMRLIAAKLSQHHYDDLDTFVSDMKRVFWNCETYFCEYDGDAGRQRFMSFCGFLRRLLDVKLEEVFPHRDFSHITGSPPYKESDRKTSRTSKSPEKSYHHIPAGLRELF